MQLYTQHMLYTSCVICERLHIQYKSVATVGPTHVAPAHSLDLDPRRVWHTGQVWTTSLHPSMKSGIRQMPLYMYRIGGRGQVYIEEQQ